jgi:deazaflavin-dependent oxidoreductase (nitroreductase family)
LDPDIDHALLVDTLIDITTVGRKTGQPRRIEIWFHYIDGRVYITGAPGSRGWYANMLANPDFTFHLKQSIQKDIPARATPIKEPDDKRRVFQRMHEVEERMRSTSIEDRVSHAPLVEIEFTG